MLFLMGRGDRQAITQLSRGFIAAVRVQMARKGMDQRELSERIGRSQAYVSKRLNGLMVFTLADVELVAEALAVAPEDLMTEAVKEAALLEA